MDVSFESGARTLSRGLRTGSAGIAGLGALLLALAVIRRGESRKILVYRTTLRPGQSLRVALTRPALDQPQPPKSWSRQYLRPVPGTWHLETGIWRLASGLYPPLMFRNRERMTRILVIFVSVMVILSMIIPFVQALRG